MLVDGGFTATGEQIVSHIRKYFGEAAELEHVVLTHADLDHASGLLDVINNLPVRNFWLHQPWSVAAQSLPFFANKTLTKEKLELLLFKEFDLLAGLCEAALAKQIPIYSPFAGAQIGPFVVLSPSQWAYTLLMPQFDRTPEPDQAALEAVGGWLGKAQRPGQLAQLLEKAVAAVQKWFVESWTNERLKDGGQTSASNESSVVLYSNDGQRRNLLTADAGVNALTRAADYADAAGYPLQAFGFVQIPHHGSRRNVGPTILNRLLGPIQSESANSRFTAFVSAPKDDATHPRQMVINAFKRRGGKVIATQGSSKIHYGGFSQRPGYTTAEEKPFVARVEDYD
jgi:beta-lactamase superfamily II metal-dependent hydrolase